jgi:hypothetical protein
MEEEEEYAYFSFCHSPAYVGLANKCQDIK